MILDLDDPGEPDVITRALKISREVSPAGVRELWAEGEVSRV